jgi:diacylglycerol kinase family enzyme
VRGLLVVNPKATTTTLRGRDVLVSALGDTLKLDCAETAHRDHAIELGQHAKAEGYDTVLVLGGDGTVNEVVNGLLSAGPSPDVPALAIVPGGSTNVFARALGLPASPMEATGQLLEALRAGRSTRVGLGKADERWFTFCAGLGLDAAAVARVEERRAKGKRSTPGLYVRSTVNRYFFGTNRTRRSCCRCPLPPMHPRHLNRSSWAWCATPHRGPTSATAGSCRAPRRRSIPGWT